MNISKAQLDTANFIKRLVTPNSTIIIRQIVEELAGSFASSSLSFFGDNAIAEAIEQIAIPQINGVIEDAIKSDSRMEKIRVWFNNKGKLNNLFPLN